jgi:hypothetical protein
MYLYSLQIKGGSNKKSYILFRILFSFQNIEFKNFQILFFTETTSDVPHSYKTTDKIVTRIRATQRGLIQDFGHIFPKTG